MPMTPDILDNWFTYHAPTDETAPRYTAIRAAECDCADLCGWLFAAAHRRAVEVVTPAGYAKVNATLRRFAEVIDASAPDSADKSAAIRCVRLARNALNETIAGLLLTEALVGRDLLERLIGIARDELTKARWQANSAVACAGR